MRKLLLITFFAGLFSILGASGAYAAPHNVTGWAWSSNIGWISFNCSNVGVCNRSNYKVTVDDNGNMAGWAWSSNIGWIKFGGMQVSDFPVNGGPGANSLVSTSSGAVTGWIRACTGTVGSDCSSMNDRNDGWDGWIKLSGPTYSSPVAAGNGGVTFDPGRQIFRGFAWGNFVVSWINFAPTIPGQAVPPTDNPYSVRCGSIVDDCRGGSTGNNTITGSCSAAPNPGMVSRTGNPVNVTLNVPLAGAGRMQGYVGAVKYYWNRDSYAAGWIPSIGWPSSNSNTYSTQYGTGNYASGVFVRDSVGNWGTFSCGTVTIVPYNPPPGSVNLMVGPTVAQVRTYAGNDSSVASHRIVLRKGDSFVIRSVNSFNSAQVSCTGVVTSTVGSYPNNWTNFGSAFGDNTFNYQTNSANAKVGGYTFKQRCTDTYSNIFDSPVVNIQILPNSSNIREI